MTTTQAPVGIHEVPEYRQQAIQHAFEWAENSLKTSKTFRPSEPNTHAYWEKAWAKEHHYWVQESTGIVYQLDARYNKAAFLSPVSADDVKEDGLVLQDGHRVQDDAVLVCQCGNDRLQVWYPESYSTYARCPECGRRDQIASG